MFVFKTTEQPTHTPDSSGKPLSEAKSLERIAGNRSKAKCFARAHGCARLQLDEGELLREGPKDEGNFVARVRRTRANGFARVRRTRANCFAKVRWTRANCFARVRWTRATSLRWSSTEVRKAI